MIKNHPYILFIVLLLSSCSRPMNMNTVFKEANFIGIVNRVNEGSILVKVNKDEDEIYSSDLISVSLDVQLKDKMKDFNVL